MSLKTYLNLNFSAMGGITGVNFPDESSKLDTIITFARATPGTRYNSSGFIETLDINQPRFDYDPNNGKCRGLLMESYRTNVNTFSESITNTVYIKSAGVTVTANQGIAPNGLLSGDQINWSAATTGAGVRHTAVPVLSGVNYATSFWIKPDTATTGALQILDVGNGGTLGPTPNFSFNGVANVISANWQRFIFTGTTLSTQTGFSLGLRKINGGIPSFYLWGLQTEMGDYPTSYITTQAAPVVRQADNAAVNTLQSWFNRDQGTLYTLYETSPQYVPGMLNTSGADVYYVTGIIDSSAQVTGLTSEAITYGPRGFVLSINGVVQSYSGTPFDLTTGTTQIGLANGLNGAITYSQLNFRPFQISEFLLASTTAQRYTIPKN